VGYGNSYDVAGVGYGYNESPSVPAAVGAGAPESAAPTLVPVGAGTVPAGISSEATNYEGRLAALSHPRTVVSGTRLTGSGSANLPTVPAISTPSIGSLGFEKSDSAPEAPQTRGFANVVVSGMAGPVGAMADSSQADGFLADFMTRLGGAFSAAGGAAEVVLGGMLFGGSAVATFGSGGTAAGLGIPGMIGGAALGAHGIDEFLAGFQTAWDGTDHRPYTAQGLDAVTGNPVASDWLNAAGGMVGSAAAGAALKSLKAAALAQFKARPSPPSLAESLSHIADDALVHFSPAGHTVVQPGVSGSIYAFRFGDIKHLTPAKIETLIGQLAAGGLPGGARVLHVLDEALENATKLPGPAGFDEYTLRKSTNILEGWIIQ